MQNFFWSMSDAQRYILLSITCLILLFLIASLVAPKTTEEASKARCPKTLIYLTGFTLTLTVTGLSFIWRGVEHIETYVVESNLESFDGKSFEYLVDTEKNQVAYHLEGAREAGLYSFTVRNQEDVDFHTSDISQPIERVHWKKVTLINEHTGEGKLIESSIEKIELIKPSE